MAPEPPAWAARWLGLMWLASPALPVGGFSYSEGLEAAVDAGWVRDEATAQHWLSDHLELVMVRCEWPALAWAHAAWQRGDAEAVRAANDWVLQTRETQELRLQTEQMGRSLAVWLAERWGNGHAAVRGLRELPGGPTWPVAFALAAHLTGAPLEPTLLSHGFSWAENQVQAAIKCIPLGQSAGQRVLQALVAELPTAVQRSLQLPPPLEGEAPQTLQAFAPGLAWWSSRHETQYSRLFRS